METTQEAVSSASSQRLGKPVLTTVDAIAQSLALGPVFSAVFIAALIAGTAGGIAPLACYRGICAGMGRDPLCSSLCWCGRHL